MKKINRHCIVAAKISYNSYKENLEYFCIEALEDGLRAKLSVNKCEYSLDGNIWYSLSAATNTPAVNAGYKIYFRGNLTPLLDEGIGTFTISKKCNLKGNIMSLLYGDDFIGKNDLSDKIYAFYMLFCNCKTIVDVSELLLPATKLIQGCYQYMFQGCTSLTAAPELPATTLAMDCYYGMFQGCTSLTTAPELTATTLSSSCYSYMFQGCTSLTAAPELPAITLSMNCYRCMFDDCTSLTAAPELPATTLIGGCYSYMFYGCTSLVTSPELPATTLAMDCYEYMFYGCKNLNYIKMLATDISASDCLYEWVRYVASSGTFVKHKDMTTLTSGVSGIPNGWIVEDYVVDYTSSYFTIEALEDGLTANLSTNSCEYRIDNGSWNTLSANTNTPSVNKGQTLSFKGNLTPLSSIGIGTFTISKKCNLKGNIMSLLYGDDFIGQTDLSGKNSSFYRLFYNCINIVDASELLLPAITLVKSCYHSMFLGCTSLTTAPELHATTLADSCYTQIFRDCISLTTAPELPATTLESGCYLYMLYGCKGLTTAPELPATTLAMNCYNGMFSGCSSLTSAPELPATTLASSCYGSMFDGCSSLTSSPKLPATTLATSCYSNMFSGCSLLTSAPALPATTLESGCYDDMFSGCISLTQAPALPATTLEFSCYRGMFSGCSNLNYIKMLATDISATICLSNWVDGVASSGTFVKHPDMNSLQTGDSGIPNGWIVEDYVETNLITFTIDGVEYQAEEGMTWEEYINSEYNTIPLTITWTFVTDINGVNAIKFDNREVYCTEEIIPNYDYLFMLITFTIDGTQHQAVNGMTWADWVNSEYNTGGYFIEQNYIYKINTTVSGGYYRIKNVKYTESIISNYSYEYDDNHYGGSND